MNTIERNRVAEILESLGYKKETAVYISMIKLVEGDDDYLLVFYYEDGASFFKEIDCEHIPYEFEDTMFEETMTENKIQISWKLFVK